jgi:undecaprenyl-diphosphatase
MARGEESGSEAVDRPGGDLPGGGTDRPGGGTDGGGPGAEGRGGDESILARLPPPLLPPLSPGTRDRIAAFDKAVDEAFDVLRGNLVADRVFYTASALGDHSLIWLILGALRGLRSEHDWKAAIRVGVILGAESALVNVGIKSLFRRTRPPWEQLQSNRSSRIKLRKPLTSSFPSGHATSAFTAAGLLADDDPLWPLYYGLAIVVAASRVYVRVHHASDVVGGIPIGIALGRIGRKLVPLPPRPTGLVG